jgi:hypothetical protein
MKNLYKVLVSIFQGRKVGKKAPKKTEQNDLKIPSSGQITKAPAQSRPLTKVRQDLIEGGVLLIVFLFAIYFL